MKLFPKEQKLSLRVESVKAIYNVEQKNNRNK